MDEQNSNGDFQPLYAAPHTRELDALRADAELWRKHKDSFAVLQAMLDAASPTILNRLKAEEAVQDAQPKANEERWIP